MARNTQGFDHFTNIPCIAPEKSEWYGEVVLGEGTCTGPNVGGINGEFKECVVVWVKEDGTPDTTNAHLHTGHRCVCHPLMAQYGIDCNNSRLPSLPILTICFIIIIVLQAIWAYKNIYLAACLMHGGFTKALGILLTVTITMVAQSMLGQ